MCNKCSTVSQYFFGSEVKFQVGVDAGKFPLLDLHQFDSEVQRGPAWNEITDALVSIS